MSLLRYPFQAFFQPKELENSLNSRPSIRKRVAWMHLALGLLWYAACGLLILPLFDERDVQFTQKLLAVILLAAATYAPTILLGFAAGGLSKRDNLLSFVVATYWSFVVSSVGLSIFFLITKAENQVNEKSWFGLTGETIATSVVPLVLMIAASIITNLHGKTRGLRLATCVSFFAASLITLLLLLPVRFLAYVTAFKNEQTGSKVLVVDYEKIKRRWNGLLPSITQPSVEYRYDYRYSETGQRPLRGDLVLIRLSDDPEQTLFTSALELTPEQLQGMIFYTLGPPQRRYYDYSLPFSSAEMADIYERLARFKGQEVRGTELRPAVRAVLPSIGYDDSNLDGYTDSVLNSFFAISAFVVEGERFQFVNQELSNLATSPTAGRDVSWEFKVPGDDDSVRLIRTGPRSRELMRLTPAGDQVWSRLLDINYISSDLRFVHSNLIHFSSDSGPQLIRLDTGEDIAAGADLGWYPAWLGEATDKFVAIDDLVYNVSPSGYIYAIKVSDSRPRIFKQPLLYGEYRRTVFKIGLWLIALYFVGMTVVVSLGLYRIPAYFFGAALQGLVLLRLRAGRKNYAGIIRMSPLLFDHVSTLRPPGTAAMLRRMARLDERGCADLIIYLLEKTQHQRLAARLFKSFCENHRGLTFAIFNNILKPEKRWILETINGELAGDGGPIPELVRAYQRLLSAKRKEPHVGGHVAVLRDFVSDYRHAREVFLTYDTFHKFYGFEHARQLADADLPLTEIQRISPGEMLNATAAEVFGLIAEMAYDLKNYDVVENFRDKQYYLSEARIKLYEITRRAEEEMFDPEAAVLLEITNRWQELIITESKALRGPAELELAISSKDLRPNDDWNQVLVTVKNVGQSPAENISLSLLENEHLTVLENTKGVRLLGTGESVNIEYTIRLKGNPQELRMYFDTTFDDFERKSKLRAFADVVKLTLISEEFKRIPNPYVVGVPLHSDKVFFGRKKALDFVLDNLTADDHHNVLIFFGQRRVGKSSLLYRLKESHLREEFLFVYIDCQGFADADTAKLLYRVCDSIQTAATGGGIALAAPRLDRFKADTFIALDEYLDEAEKALGPKKLVLMLDEYEYLEYKVKDGSVSPEIFNKLRNLMQHRNKKMTFIFVGTHRLQELTSNYWSFLFNIALYHEIGPLGESEAKALIVDPVRGYLRFDDLAVDKILRVTGLHPYFIQGTCRAIVNYCNSRRKNYVTLTDVNEVMREAVESSTAHVKYLYQDYSTEPERAVLTFLSNVTDETKLFSTANEISRFATENRFRYEPKQVQETLAGLKNKRLVREDKDNRGELFGFEYEFLRIWIKEHVRMRDGSLTTL